MWPPRQRSEADELARQRFLELESQRHGQAIDESSTLEGKWLQQQLTAEERARQLEEATLRLQREQEEQERRRKREEEDHNRCIHTSLSLSLYIYIYIWIDR